MTRRGGLELLRVAMHGTGNWNTAALTWAVRTALRLPVSQPVPEPVWQDLDAARALHESGQYTQAEWALRALVDKHTKDEN